MMHRVRGYGLAATLVFLSTIAVVPRARAASSTAAYVYIQIQGPAGAVYGFTASSAGKVSTISGSPFKPAGAMIGGTSTKFFTLGQTLIHSYPVAADGALGSQLSQEPVFDYQGSDCGGGTSGEDGAVLDHTGKYIYVMLFNPDAECTAYQSYIIQSDGAFSFDGDTELSGGMGYGGYGVPSILGNETFAYSYYSDSFGPLLDAFRRESSGTLEYLPDFSWTAPTVADGYQSGPPDASPAGNYVVLPLSVIDQASPAQLGSFTVGANGNLTTTNTSSNMPSTKLSEFSTTFSPSGKFLVAYGTSGGTNANAEGGIEIYNFKGAAPLTLYTTLLEGTPINQVVWDSSNHMYAISAKDNKLYVFTVTSTSVTEDSSWSIGAPYSMVVVSE